MAAPHSPATTGTDPRNAAEHDIEPAAPAEPRADSPRQIHLPCLERARRVLADSGWQLD